MKPAERATFLSKNRITNCQQLRDQLRRRGVKLPSGAWVAVTRDGGLAVDIIDLLLPDSDVMAVVETPTVETPTVETPTCG